MTSQTKAFLLLAGIFIMVVTLGVLLFLRFEKNIPIKHKPYNVLMISVDTLRSDHMGVYGYAKKTTPNIDSWAKKDGIIFTKAYTQVPITYPSFVSSMTGLSPFQTSIYNNGRVRFDKDGKMFHEGNSGNRPLEASVPTLAEILHKNGYSTGAYVFNSVLGSKISGLNRGFDDYNIVGDNYRSSTEGFLGDILSWLDEKRVQKEPFFLWAHFLDPHEAFTPEEQNKCLFAGDLCNEIKASPMSEFAQQEKKLQGCQLTPLDDKTVGIQKALYDAELYQTDTQVGEILSYVHENNLDDDTIIIFYSDHGEGFDHNYYFTHSEMLHESSVKIPYIISTPESRGKSRQEDVLVDNTQTLATTLSLLGFEKQTPANQVSVFGKAKNTLFYINQSKTKFAIREGNMKYIFTNVDKGSRCTAAVVKELYDLASDPDETKNLVDALPEVVEKLHGKLMGHVRKSEISNRTRVEKPSSVVTPVEEEDDQEALKEIRELGY